MSESQAWISMFLVAYNQSNKTHSGRLLRSFALNRPNCFLRTAKKERERASGCRKVLFTQICGVAFNKCWWQTAKSFFSNEPLSNWKMNACDEQVLCVLVSHVWELGNWCFTIRIVHFGFDVYRFTIEIQLEFHWNGCHHKQIDFCRSVKRIKNLVYTGSASLFFPVFTRTSCNQVFESFYLLFLLVFAIRYVIVVSGSNVIY